MLGTPVDLSTVTVDTYVTAGIADHLCPWQACYRTTQLLGGESRFILSTSGHIASLVNPPGNPKSTFQVADDDARRPAGVAGVGRDGAGLLVAGLHGLAGRAVAARRSRRPTSLGGELPELADGTRAPMSSTSSPSPAPRALRPDGHRGRPHAAGGRPARDGRVRAAAAADERHRREPGGAAALRRRARPPAHGRPVRRPRGRRLAAAGRPLQPGHVQPGRGRRCSTGSGYDEPVDVLGLSWGGGLAQHFAVQHRRRVPPAGPGRDRHRHADGAGPSAGAGPDAHPAPAPRPGLRPRRSPARSTAARCAPIPSAAARALHAATRLGPRRGYYYQLAAEHRLEQPAVPAADPAAHAGRRRRRRPDHPGGQRADHGPADPRRPAAPLLAAATSR